MGIVIGMDKFFGHCEGTQRVGQVLLPALELFPPG